MYACITNYYIYINIVISNSFHLLINITSCINIFTFVAAAEDDDNNVCDCDNNDGSYFDSAATSKEGNDDQHANPYKQKNVRESS
jgi:hypothetical protein